MTRIRRILLTMCLLVASVGVLGAGVYLVWLRTPPPMPATIDEAVALIDSPRFARLAESRRQPYVQRMTELMAGMGSLEMSALRQRFREDASLHAAARELGMSFLAEQARRYVHASEPERQLILDRAMAMPLSRGRSSSAGESDRGRPSRQWDRSRHQSLIERGNPQDQAYIQEFWRAIRERRRQQNP